MLGPFLNLHLSGGRGGIEHLLEHLGLAIESWWKDLGDPSLTDELQRKVTDEVHQMLMDRTSEKIETQRDALLRDLLHAKSDALDLP